MGPFCGIVNIDPDFDQRANLDAMTSVFTGELPGAVVKQYHEGAVLAQKSFHTTYESELDQFPLYDEDFKLTIVGDIRLDNRAELFLKLGISRHVQSEYSDARLVLTSYKNWGDHCPQYLLGEFCFAIWDDHTKQLFCCTDHMGSRNIFYYFDRKQFIFASSPAIIQAVKGVNTGINHNKLISLVKPDAKHLFRAESWYKNIFPVPAATTLTYNTGNLHQHKYWTPEIGKELSFKNETDFAESFQEVFYNSVECRLRSNLPVTALLSGGLDSSAVASVAAKILQKQNREFNVLSVVLSDPADGIFKDERYFIDQFRAFPNININYITVPERGFFSGLGDVAGITNDLTLSSRHYLYTAFSETAHQLGSSVILEGACGELGPTSYGEGAYSELFVKLRWMRLYNELHDRKNVTGESIIKNIKTTIKPLLPQFLIDANKEVQTKDKFDTCFIQPQLAEKLISDLDLGELKKYTGKPSWNHRVNQLDLLLRKQKKGFGGLFHHDTELRYPMMDKRLLEFCLALPLDLKVNKGYKRYAIRAGLNNILPPEIQWRNSKTAFSPDYNRRYKQQLPQVKDYLNAIAPDDPVREIIDIDKIKSWTNYSIADTGNSPYHTTIIRDHVPQSIFLINFLRRFKEFKI